MAAKPDGPRRPSAEEMALFDRAMRETRRLEPKAPRARRPAPPPVAKPKAAAPAKPPPKPATLPPPPPPAPSYVVERRRSVPGLDRRTTERLARGRLPIEARLDLHGERQEGAHRALNAFILEASRAGRRCVLVVTGKGQGERGQPLPIMSGEAPGVLRRNLPRWLGQPPLAEKVLAIRPALPQHGGEGAFYVLLRRQRD